MRKPKHNKKNAFLTGPLGRGPLKTSKKKKAKICIFLKTMVKKRLKHI